jgi:DNA-binding transcriptional LysR family regulator
VLAALPTTSEALELVAATDAVTVVAEQVCRSAGTRLGPDARPLPVELPRVPVILAWHHRYDSDPAHAWLRDRVRDALRTTLGPRRVP